MHVYLDDSDLEALAPLRRRHQDMTRRLSWLTSRQGHLPLAPAAAEAPCEALQIFMVPLSKSECHDAEEFLHSAAHLILSDCLQVWRAMCSWGACTNGACTSIKLFKQAAKLDQQQSVGKSGHPLFLHKHQWAWGYRVSAVKFVAFHSHHDWRAGGPFK